MCIVESTIAWNLYAHAAIEAGRTGASQVDIFLAPENGARIVAMPAVQVPMEVAAGVQFVGAEGALTDNQELVLLLLFSSAEDTYIQRPDSIVSPWRKILLYSNKWIPFGAQLVSMGNT